MLHIFICLQLCKYHSLILRIHVQFPDSVYALAEYESNRVVSVAVRVHYVK